MEPDRSLTRFARQLHSPDARQRDEAASVIWLHFAERLGALVRRRLDPRLLRRASVEDVVQSLFASFFAASPGPGGPPRSREDLWRLLVHFTMCKVASTAERHRAQRRDVFRERSMTALASDSSPADWADGQIAAPEDEVVAREEFARLLAVLPDDLQQVFALRLEGWSNAEIAVEIGRVERTVELKLRAIRGLIRPHLDPSVLDGKFG